MSGNGNAAEVLDLAQRWAAAEQRNDAGLLGGSSPTVSSAWARWVSF
jgi:hypothetical protein